MSKRIARRSVAVAAAFIAAAPLALARPATAAPVDADRTAIRAGGRAISIGAIDAWGRQLALVAAGGRGDSATAARIRRCHRDLHGPSASGRIAPACRTTVEGWRVRGASEALLALWWWNEATRRGVAIPAPDGPLAPEERDVLDFARTRLPDPEASRLYWLGTMASARLEGAATAGLPPVTDADVAAERAAAGRWLWTPERRVARVASFRSAAAAIAARRAGRGVALRGARRIALDRLRGELSLPVALETAVLGARPGGVRGPLRAGGRHWLFALERIEAQRPIPLARLRDDLAERLARGRELHAKDALQEQLFAHWRPRTRCDATLVPAAVRRLCAGREPRLRRLAPQPGAKRVVARFGRYAVTRATFDRWLAAIAAEQAGYGGRPIDPPRFAACRRSGRISGWGDRLVGSIGPLFAREQPDGSVAQLPPGGALAACRALYREAADAALRAALAPRYVAREVAAQRLPAAARGGAGGSVAEDAWWLEPLGFRRGELVAHRRGWVLMTRLDARLDALVPQPSQRRVAAHYRLRRASDYRVPPRSLVRLLELRDRASARRALAALRGGEPFEQVAAREGVAPPGDGAPNRVDGREGVVTHPEPPAPDGPGDDRGPREILTGDERELSNVPWSIASAIADAQPGALAGPLRAAGEDDRGWFVFRVEQHLPAHVRPLSEVGDGIAELLHDDDVERAQRRMWLAFDRRYAARTSCLRELGVSARACGVQRGRPVAPPPIAPPPPGLEPGGVLG